MQPIVLQCGIVGAGIAGLCTAIALQRAGHEVELFERSEFKNETGAAITITPNAQRILDRWGFDRQKAQVSEFTTARFISWDTGEEMVRRDFSDAVKRFDGTYATYHRVDLHNHLKEMAAAAGARLTLSAKVVSIIPDEGTIVLEDGRNVKKDLVVLADGINTHLVQDILGFENPGRLNTSSSVYRALVPMEKINADPVAASLFKNQPPSFTSSTPSANGCLWFAYPCRNQSVLNLGLSFRTEPGRDRAWNTPVNIEDFYKCHEGFHPSFLAASRKAEDVRTYSTDIRATLDFWIRGRAVVIGDAAHAMFPFYAQGGAMSIEDAAAFEIIFKDVASAAEVPDRLELYQKVRLPRANAVQILSNTASPSGLMNNEYTIALGVDRDASVRKYWDGDIPKEKLQWCPDMVDFLYSYDIFRESQLALDRWIKQR